MDTENPLNNDQHTDTLDDERQNDTCFIKQIHRFKFSDNFMNILNQFSKLHQNDNRKDYKDAWKIWCEGNSDAIREECKRLNELGYDGNIQDKMYRSSRYYFRKKPTVKPEPRKRRKYISCEHDLLMAMDKHIADVYKKQTTPADGYTLFCENNSKLLKEEITKIIDTGMKDKEMITGKIKKTYKNRYFLYIKNNS